MNRPLEGHRVLVTAERRASERLAVALRSHGANCDIVECLVLKPPLDQHPLLRSIERLGGYDWLVFTSRNSVEAVRSTMEIVGARALPRDLRIAAIGAATATALEVQLGRKADLVPGQATADALLSELLGLGLAGRRLLLPQGNLADERLLRGLSASGAAVDRVEAYRTVEGVEHPDQARAIVVAVPPLSAVTMMSGSAVSALFAALGRELFLEQRLVCIGPSTAKEVRQLGGEPLGVALPHTIEGLTEAVVAVVLRGSVRAVATRDPR